MYDYRLLSQYLDFAGKAKPSLFIFLLLLCVVSAYVLYVGVCTHMHVCVCVHMCKAQNEMTYPGLSLSIEIST